MAVPLIAKNKKIVETQNLYHWHKNWDRVQRKFFDEPYKLKRSHKIEQFVANKQFKKVHHIKDNYIDFNFTCVNNIKDTDLILITDQKISRLTCENIIKTIKLYLNQCSNVYLCLNRHYLNITGYPLNIDLPDDYEEAIETWLKESLQGYTINNLSEKYVDDGSYFTWVIPDQHFHISK
jgi:hypothetical protein